MGKYDDQKLQVLGLLKVGELTKKEIARDYGIPYSTVMRWSKEAEAIEVSEDLQTVMDVEPEVLHSIADKVKDEFEKIVKDADVLVDGIVEGIGGVKLLEDELQKAATTLSQKLHALALSCNDPKDLMYIVDGVSKMQTAFFAKGANVNVLNVQASDKKISKYKALQRAS